MARAKVRTAEDIKKLREIERKREFMCAHYPLCRGCPLEKAANDAKMKCHDFRIRRPDENARIVLEWEFHHVPSARPLVE